MQPSPDPLLTWLSNAGALGILAFAVIAFLRGWVVPGSAFTRVLAERDEAQELAHRLHTEARDERAALRQQLEEERVRYRELERRFTE